jgi:hypothetical protein
MLARSQLVFPAAAILTQLHLLKTFLIEKAFIFIIGPSLWNTFFHFEKYLTERDYSWKKAAETVGWDKTHIVFEKASEVLSIKLAYCSTCYLFEGVHRLQL